jgi:hypothetical protein
LLPKADDMEGTPPRLLYAWRDGGSEVVRRVGGRCGEGVEMEQPGHDMRHDADATRRCRVL